MVAPDLQRVFERAQPGARKAHKRAVMACALEVFEREGLEAATMDAIRHAAGSSIWSIYHHFGNKDGLVAALFFAALDDQAMLAEPMIAAARSAREAIRASIRAYLEWVTAQPRLARFVYRAHATVAAGPQGPALEERNRVRHRALRHLINQGVEAGQLRALPRETWVPLLIGPSETYCRAWLSDLVTAPPVDHVELFADAAWRTVATGAPGQAHRQAPA